jgi:hypothetical protein
MGYPSADAELEMVQGRDTSNPFDGLEAVASIEDAQAWNKAETEHWRKLTDEVKVELPDN